MKCVYRLLLGSVLAIGLLQIGGCSTYDIVMTPQPELRGVDGSMRTAVVDIVGVGEAEVARWRSIPVTEYVSGAGNSMRKDSENIRFTTEFNASKTQTITLSKDDPIWTRWNKPAYLVVIANVPETPTSKDLEGEKDPRRLVLAIKDLSWSTKELQISVKGGSVSVLAK